MATPAAAHSELVSISPANGAQLKTPPIQVQMTFTESVKIGGGIRLVDEVGRTVDTSDPTVDGHTVTWRMPADLPDGAYIVTWRVVSADGHPVSGASSFGVGTAAAAVPGSATGTGATGTTGSIMATGSTTLWPVVIVRMTGYVAFALFAGVAAFALFCAPDTSKDPALQRLARGGLIGGAAAAVAAVLIQGPYMVGVSMSHALECCNRPWRLHSAPRWCGGSHSTASSVCSPGDCPRFSASSAAASGPFDLSVDALHALTAGLWVGGLFVLVALGRSVEPRVLHKFSTLALASVLALIATGALNALRHLNADEQLWQTRYGLTLLIKLTLVAGTLTAAAVSRRRLQQNRVPLRSVRFEAALTMAVLAVTALLTLTTPPPQAAAPTDHTGHSAGPDTVQLSLGDQGNAALTAAPTMTGSDLYLQLTDTNSQRLRATRVTLRVANPGRDIAPIPVRMTTVSNGVWVANYRFPFSGTWKAILTVDGIGPSAVVTTADITIRS